MQPLLRGWAWLRLCGSVLCLISLSPLCLAQAPEDSADGHVTLLVDGKPLQESTGQMQIPAFHRNVGFRLGKSAQDDPQGCRRMRFKLAGMDESWRQIESEMCVQIRFADARGDQVGQRLFPVDGASVGWQTDAEDSAFTQRMEVVKVPAEAVSATMVISSSGPPTALGLFVVKNIKIRESGPQRTQLIYETGSSIEPEPAGWTRSGTRPSMAKILPTRGGYAFGILDDDPGAHAEWSMTRDAALPVSPGEQLTVEWSEMYNIGMGNRFDVNYGQLSAGSHTFWSEVLNPAGQPIGAASQLTFKVLKPFWRSVWFWLIATVSTGLLLWLACRAIIKWRIRMHLAKVKQERALEQERLRIARDLHDDLGARLTHISLMSGLAENDPQSRASRESFQRISGMARELVAALYQTVWSVNPEHDNLEALVNYLCQLTQNLCESARIRCRIHSCDVPGQLPVSSEVRHNITLAVKEALHNTVKHSAATEVNVSMEFHEPLLKISISDNGHGFHADDAMPGNGLRNMQSRMDSVGGHVTIHSMPGKGTTVTFEVALEPAQARSISNSTSTPN